MAIKLSDKNKDFFTQVYQVVGLIPEGRATNYGAIARYLGSARSSRMVGWAMNGAHKHDPSLPAHRVVNRLGVLTGKVHFSHPEAMAEKLRAEGIEVVDDQIVRFKEVFWDPNEELKW